MNLEGILRIFKLNHIRKWEFYQTGGESAGPFSHLKRRNDRLN